MNRQDNNRQAPRVLISGGGTGGHIFPALSIANAIQRRWPEAGIQFVGALGRMEMERVPDAGYAITGLPVAGFDRKRLWRNFGVLLKLYRSMRIARRLVRDFRPDIAIGVGGYASGPTLKAAQQASVPTLLQEQNSYPGVTNKMLAQKARCICVAYDGTERFFPADVIVKTGNPVRKAITECALTQADAKRQLGFSADKPLILAVGGSLGAGTVNAALAESLPLFDDKGVQLMWQTGKYYADRYIPLAGHYGNVKASAFITDMATAYRAADLVISRAGAGTISELQLLGKAAVLVPSPNVAEDHQRKNALALADRNAAVLVEDADAREKLGATAAALVTDGSRLKTLGANALAMALPDADTKIVDQIEKILYPNSTL